MLEPEEVSAILRLNELGWGAKRNSRELGISRNTAKLAPCLSRNAGASAVGLGVPCEGPRLASREALDPYSHL